MVGLGSNEEEDQGFVFIRRRNAPIQESIIPIPHTETPIIKKNQAIRQSKRRSSLEKRGKRASSIGNGFVAKPHPDVNSNEFFRHIQAELPEPIKLRQLLAWCGLRSLDKQTSADENALKIAKIIEQEVLNDLIDGKISTSWYNRQNGHESLEKTLPRKPHPQNLVNQRKLKEHEATLQRLKAEYEEWTKLISEINSFHASVVNVSPSITGTSSEGKISILPDEIDMSFLPEEQHKFLLQYCNEDEKNKINEIEKIIQPLESQLDHIYHSFYHASKFNTATQIYCENLHQKLSSTFLHKQRLERGEIETKHVLQAFSRIR
ncbi:kinetochore-associated protein Dsn1/Mis13 [Gigaspora rosea]|uniref:Kinetochore-associated protein Dsn1/Mis13 n=1 Tax=Gigaspora rosea TaxID=44941 RepID=A0A397V6U6_9GLOM|nr:kinetochore-associated protein Dsn1/Mis13 [Gigaspora rosea]